MQNIPSEGVWSSKANVIIYSRRLEGGDIMHAHDIVPKRMDGRGASFIRVCELLYCQMFFEANLSLSFPDSMSNLLIETSAIKPS
jgi:hypothetical protein